MPTVIENKKERSIQKRVIAELLEISKKPLLLVFGTAALLVVIVPVLTYLFFIQDLADKERIMNRNNTGITLLDRDGKPFFTFSKPRTIQYVTLSDIPLSIQQAVIATEDQNFYENPGFSVRGIFRAFVVNLLARRIEQGGSTITQELVKNVLLSPQQSFVRKYQEVILAAELSRRYSKKDILEMYLNSVYFGEGAFGIENAAENYFGKHANTLTLSESTLLAGLLPAPSALSPLSNNPDKATKRQKLVLAQMVQQGYIKQQEAEEAEAIPIVFKPNKETVNVVAPHFALFVKDMLIKQYGEERAVRSGFQVRTTLRQSWQTYAENVVERQVNQLRYNRATNGAAIVIDPKTGEILALVGSKDWNDEKFGKTNMVLALRQPGSSFKPIIYSAALEKNLITPATILKDEPTTFLGNYKPHDFDFKYRGPVTVRRALANSLNIPAVAVMQKVGVSDGIAMAKRLGITSLTDPSRYGLSLVLGAGEVRLLELTSAFSGFANGGVRNQPTVILEIKDKYGKPVTMEKPVTEANVSEAISFIISSILSDNSARAETFGNALTISRPAAVKTGTTEDFRDALTVGYTPNLAIGVWVGNNDNTPMGNIAGSLGAAPIWRALMEQFLRELPYETFKKPPFVISEMVCPYKQLNLDTKETTQAGYMEFFLAGTQPQTPCAAPSATTTVTGSPTPTPSQTPVPSQAPTPIESGPTPIPQDSPTPTPIQLELSPTVTLFPNL